MLQNVLFVGQAFYLFVLNGGGAPMSSLEEYFHHDVINLVMMFSACTGFCPSPGYFVLTERIFQHQSLITSRFQKRLTELQYCPHVPFQFLYVPLPTFAFQSP